jgi:hypothetical protein
MVEIIIMADMADHPLQTAGCKEILVQQLASKGEVTGLSADRAACTDETA